MKARFLLSGLVVFAATNVDAQVIKAIDFSSAQGYVDGPITGQPAGAATVWQDGFGVPAGDHITVENGAMRIYQDGSGLDTWTYIEFPNQNSGVFTVTFDWQYVGPEDSNIDVGVCISDVANFDFDGNPFLSWAEQSVMVRMQEAASVIDVRDGDWAGGGTYTAFEPYPYTDGEKIFMRYVIDATPNGQTYDVYARKEGEAEVQLAADFGFRREYVNGLNALTIWMDGAAADTAVILDNIVIAGPTDVQDWTLY